MAATMQPRPWVPGRGDTGRRTVRGALLGAAPGVLLMIVNLVAVRGEAVLTVGVGAVFLTLGGAVAGAVLGARGSAAGRTLVGALLGALVGVLAFFVPGMTRLSPLILIAGAIAGGMIAGQPRRGGLSPPPPPPPPSAPSNS